MPDDTLGGVGEDALVAALIAGYRPLPVGVRVGPGDDAAVLDVAGPVAVTTDTLVEGHDFRRDWSSAFDVGAKTAAQNLADVAAMGAAPIALLVSLAAPAGLPVRWARDLADGLAQECRRAGAAVVGGDVSMAGEIVITGTALGVLSGSAVLRSGARPGDVVALAGRTGPSAAGLALLGAGRGAPGPVEGDAGTGVGPDDAHLTACVRAHLAPRPPYPAGPAAAAAGATALIDTSDGLVRDARRLAAASGVLLDLDPDALGPAPDLVAVAELLGVGDPGRQAIQWSLTGGEDHALLACFPPGTALPEPFRTVGRVLAAPGDGGPGVGGPGVLVGGLAWTGPGGWQHFSG